MRETFGAAERRIVEVRPCIDRAAVFQRDARKVPRIQARFRLVGAASLKLIQRLEDDSGVRHPVHLPPDARIGGGHRRRVDPEIEERRGDRAATQKEEVLVDTQLSRPIERRHQRAVEEHEIDHLPLEVLFGRIYATRRPGVYGGSPSPAATAAEAEGIGPLTHERDHIGHVLFEREPELVSTAP
jgi:hypothetical protein